MFRSSLCDYSDAYKLVKGTKTVANTAATGQPANNADKKVIFKICVPFINCTSRINNTQADDVHDIYVVMSMSDLIEHSENYSKTSVSLWHYCRDESSLDNNDAITDFNVANVVTNSFKIKEKITGQKGDNGTKNIEIKVPLKYLSDFWRTLEMPLINCEINLDLNWSAMCVIVATAVANQGATFSITDTELYVPAVTLSTQDNTKLLEQLKSRFKRTINWKKYQSKKSTERQNQYLDYLIDPSFQGLYRLFVLSFEDGAQRTRYKRYYLPTVEMKNYIVMINEQNFFDQPVRSNLMTYDSIQKIAAGQGDDYTTGCLLDIIILKKIMR